MSRCNVLNTDILPPTGMVMLKEGIVLLFGRATWAVLTITAQKFVASMAVNVVKLLKFKMWVSACFYTYSRSQVHRFESQ